MTEHSGVVSYIEDKDWKNNIVLWHFQLNGESAVFNCGTIDPKLSIGAAIRFVVHNRKVDTSSIVHITAEEALKENPPKLPAPSAGNQSMPTTGTARLTGDVGARIRRQLARKDAVLLVTTAMSTELLPYPKSGKAKDKWDRMLDLIYETTNDLLEQEEEWIKRS